MADFVPCDRLLQKAYSLRLCCTPLDPGVLRARLFSILMLSSRLKELLQICFGSYLILVLFRIVVWNVVFNDKLSSLIPLEGGQELKP